MAYWPDTNTGVDIEPARKPVASAVRKFFTEGGIGQAPTVPGGDWFNQITNEVLNVLEAAGIEPSKTDDDQLLESIKRVSNSTSSREALRRSYAEAGYNLVDGSFESGGTLSSTSDVLTYEATGEAYSWTGAYPGGSYSVPQDTNPTTNPLFVNKSASLLRSLLMGGGSLSMPCNVINVDLPPYSGDLSALIESVDSNTAIVLGNRDYDLSSNPQFNGVKQNITLFGSGMPTYSSDGTRMEGGTRLLGNNTFGVCDGFSMHNLGIDCGNHVIDYLYGGTSKDGLLSIGSNQFFDNVRVMIKSDPAQLKHGIIFEGHENITHGFLETRGGYHGYVAKSKNVNGGDVVVNETAGTMAIFKADKGMTYSNIRVKSIAYFGKDGLTPSLIFEAINNGTLSDVHIGRFVGRNSGPGVAFTKDTSAGSLSDIHIDVLDLDGCAGNGFALDNQLVGRVSIGHHSLKNCSGQGFYIDRGYSLNIGSGEVVNAGQNGYFFGGNLNRNNIQFGDIRADGCGQYGVRNDALIPINPGKVLGSSNASGLVSANFGDIIVALGSGWTNDFFASKVMKMDRLVTLSGIVISNKTSAVIMTLPAHLRPSVTEVFSCPVSAPVASGAVNMVRVFVQSDTGQVKIDTSAVSSVGAVVLSGISFFTAY